MVITESWDLEREPFDGVWILSDSESVTDPEVLAACLALVLVVRVVANAVHRQWRGEDLRDDVAEARDYIDTLSLRGNHRRQLRRLLAALLPFQPERVGEELLGASWLARQSGLDRSARCLAELAYETRMQCGGSETVAQGAARALARLAQMEECPRAARKWRRIAHVHGRRAGLRSIVVE